MTFNNEYAGWRIISIEDDTFKLIRNNSIGEQYLDGEWKDSTAQTYLNGTYYNSLNSTVQSQIITHDWNVGENISIESNDSKRNTNGFSKINRSRKN